MMTRAKRPLRSRAKVNVVQEAREALDPDYDDFYDVWYDWMVEYDDF